MLVIGYSIVMIVGNVRSGFYILAHLTELRTAQFGGIDAEGLAEGGRKISVIGKSVFKGKQVEARGGMFEHVLGGVEEAQAFDVVMEGHARVLFEDATQMIRRKMDRRRNMFQLQR